MAPRPWSGDELLASRDRWRIDLRKDHPALLASLEGLARDLPWRDYLRAPEVPELEPLSARVRSLLWREHHITVLRTGPDASDEAMRLLILLVGRALGRNAAPTVGGEPRPLFAVTATDDPTVGGEYGGNARNARELPMHTDGSGVHSGRVDVLGMLCIRPAAEGGVSRFADARTAYAGLDDQARALLAQPLPRVDPYQPHLPVDRLICRPVFDAAAGDAATEHLTFSYHPQRIRTALRARDGERADSPIERALAGLDQALERSAAEVMLDRGDLVLLDNTVIAHGRAAFHDPPAQLGRLLERLWVEVDPEVSRNR